MCEQGYRNVWLLSIAFMLLFTAFQSLGIITKTIIESIKFEDPNFKLDGYHLLAIVYVFFAIVNLFAPLVISKIGPRVTMIIGAVCYIGYIVSFMYPVPVALYLMSVVLGFGAAFVWTGQGNYLILNSPKKFMSRNSGTFWGILQLSMIAGNMLIYFMFSNEEYIAFGTRRITLFCLLGVAVAALIFFIILPRSIRQDAISSELEEKPGPLKVLSRAITLIKTKHIIFLCFAYFYSGLELAFFSGIYGSSVGFTMTLHNSKSLIGLTGIAIGLGEVAGGVTFGVLGVYTTKIGRSTIVTIGLVVHIITYILVYINLPNNSPFGNTRDLAIIKSSEILAVVCGFTLGLGDACYNTQFYNTIGTNYPNNSASSFAIFKFFQNLGAFTAFLYSTALDLHGSLIVLLTFGIIGTFFFILSERVKVDEDKLFGDIIESNMEANS